MTSNDKMSEANIIVRKYGSGKYYSTMHREYLNRKQLFGIFRSTGHIMKIVCVSTGKDITNIEIPKISNGMKVDVNDIKELFI